MKRTLSGQPVVQPLNSNDAEVPEDDILNFFKAGQTFLSLLLKNLNSQFFFKLFPTKLSGLSLTIFPVLQMLRSHPHVRKAGHP